MQDFVPRVYAHLPVAVQNLAFSGWGLKLKHQRFGAEFRRQLARLKDTEWWTATRIADCQNQRLRETVKHAYDTVPYYHDTMRAVGLTPADIRNQDDLHKMPILSKQDARDNNRRLVSRAYKWRKLHRILTSGTTGTPLCVYWTREALQFQWAVIWRHQSRFGASFGDRSLVFGARLPVPIQSSRPPFWRDDWSLKRTYLSVYHLTPDNMPAIVNWLNTRSFAFFRGYPSAMFILANFIRANKLEVKNPPECVFSCSDALIPAFKRLIGIIFRAPVADHYGSVEGSGCFSQCEHGKYHLDAEFCHVELAPIPGVDDPRRRRLICTNLVNPAMPFIRYDIGDFGMVSEGPCVCGRESLTLDRIEGRTEDYVRTPDGRMAIGMNQVFEWAPGILEAQIRQEVLEEITVLVVPAPEYCLEDQEILERELRKRVGDVIKIRFERVDHIPQTRSGKFRAVVSRLPPATNEELALQNAVEHGGL